MLDKILGSIIDKEQITRDVIIDTLQDIKEELQCEQTDLYIMIKPFKSNGEFNCYVFQNKEVEAIGKVPTIVREITLKEILGG